MTKKYMQYEHHEKEVWVREDLKGKHRDMCLCYGCTKFESEAHGNNCPIATILYSMCVENNLVTPVFECPDFEEERTVRTLLEQYIEILNSDDEPLNQWYVEVLAMFAEWCDEHAKNNTN